MFSLKMKRGCVGRLNCGGGTHTRAGATLILIVMLLPVIVLLCAFTVNLAYMELNRTELYTVADAAARAGGRELTISRDQAQAVSVAKQIASLNSVAGEAFQLRDSDIEFGKSLRAGSGRYKFTPGGRKPNAVRVNARRDSGSLGGSIPLLFPNVIGGSKDFSAGQSAISTQVDVDIALVIDRSGSMAYAANEVSTFSFKPNSAPAGWGFCDPAPPNCRWRNLVIAVDVFLNEISLTPINERVALCTYNQAAMTNQDLTTNYGKIMGGLEPFTASFCAGGTNIGGGINEGVAALSVGGGVRLGAIKVLIVMTDGIHNIGPSPIGAAANAAKQGTMIFTVTFSNEADQALMQKVASQGNGVHFHANSPADLVDVFRAIATHLPTLLTD